MRAGYLSLLSLAGCPLAGWPLLAHPSYRRLSFPCRVGLSCAVGAVVLSCWMTVFALLGIAWRPVVLVLMAVLVSYLLRLLLPSSEAAQEEVPARESRTSLAEKLALVVIVISVLAALAAAASASATSPDLLLFWGPTAMISAPRKSRLVLLPLAVSAVLAAFFVFIYLHGEINPGKWIEWSAASSPRSPHCLSLPPSAGEPLRVKSCRRDPGGGGAELLHVEASR